MKVKLKRLVNETAGEKNENFYDKKILERIKLYDRVDRETIESVRKWYEYEMRFPNPFPQNEGVMRDLCEDIFRMWEHRGGITEREMRKVQEHISCGKSTHLSGLMDYLNGLLVVAECLLQDNAQLRAEYGESTKRGRTKMKKLNVTKERFEKSRYFTNKYGKLEYVSESGKLFKTDKGNVLKFKESKKVNEGFFGDLGEEIGDRIDSGVSGIRKFFHGKPKFKKGDSVMLCMIEWYPCIVSHGGTITKTKWGDDKWYYEVDFDGERDVDWWPEDALAVDTDPEAGSEELDEKSMVEKYPEFRKRARTILGKKMCKELGIDESTKKQPKKVVKESASDIANDPAYQCPYCGSHDCEFDDAENSPNEGYFDGATFNAQFFCNECNKPYNVQFELKVKDVYPNEDADNFGGEGELGYDE